MKRTAFATTAIAAFLLSGCTAAPIADGRPHILPVERVQHAMNRADAMYHTGRYFQGQIRYEQAQQAYREALALNPDHVPALNGLAIIAANQGRFAEAERHFQQAIALAPNDAYLYNNLGYAYLRADRPDEGQTALAKAVDLAPDNPHYAANFAKATEALALRRHKLAAERAHKASTPEAAPRQSADESNLLLEVANGNGVRGMAARTAGLLREFGLPATRLTNARPYRQWQTEIQYLAGHEQEAILVQAALPVAARLVEIEAMQRGIELRVVVGHDLRSPAALHVRSDEPLRIALADASGRIAP